MKKLCASSNLLDLLFCLYCYIFLLFYRLEIILENMIDVIFTNATINTNDYSEVYVAEVRLLTGYNIVVQP